MMARKYYLLTIPVLLLVVVAGCTGTGGDATPTETPRPVGDDPTEHDQDGDHGDQTEAHNSNKAEEPTPTESQHDFPETLDSDLMEQHYQKILELDSFRWEGTWFKPLESSNKSIGANFTQKRYVSTHPDYVVFQNSSHLAYLRYSSPSREEIDGSAMVTIEWTDRNIVPFATLDKPGFYEGNAYFELVVEYHLAENNTRFTGVTELHGDQVGIYEATTIGDDVPIVWAEPEEFAKSKEFYGANATNYSAQIYLSEKGYIKGVHFTFDIPDVGFFDIRVVITETSGISVERPDWLSEVE